MGIEKRTEPSVAYRVPGKKRAVTVPDAPPRDSEPTFTQVLQEISDAINGYAAHCETKDEARAVGIIQGTVKTLKAFFSNGENQPHDGAAREQEAGE